MRSLNTILSKVLAIDEDSITDDMSPDNVETWDSFNALMLVSELENEYKVKFTMEEVVGVKCVGDIKSILKKYGIKYDA